MPKECEETREEELARLKRKTRYFIAGYFFSLAFMVYCAFELMGQFGAMGAVAGFGVYWFHLNMKFHSTHVAVMEHDATSETSDGIMAELADGAGRGQYI